MSNPAGGPTTWFSGQSAPEDQRGANPMLLIGLAFVLYSPLGALALVGCYIAFNYYRVSHKVIVGAAALYTALYGALVWIFSSAGSAFDTYNKPWGRLINAVRDKHTNGFIAHNWWFWFSHQIWLSLAFGLVFGAAWTSWKWLRRPAWEDNDRVPGPIHRLRRRRVITEIAADIGGPTDGATIGVDPFGARVVQTEAEASAHTLLAGGSGAGKSTTMMIGIRDAIRKGEPVCVIDLKGAADLPAQLAEWSQRYGRRFLHWSITDHRAGYKGPADGPAFYDPIGRGDPSRKKDLLIGSEKWDVEYYKSVNENYLQAAFKIAELVPNAQVDAFTDLAALLDMDKLKQRAAALFMHAPKTPQGQQHAAAHALNSRWWEQYPTVLDPYVASTLGNAADILMKPEEGERSAVRNMAARVQKLRQSTAGAWLKRDPEHGRDIDLRKVADEGWVVVFSLDSSNYEATSAQVGGLIIQDLKTLSSELRASPAPRPFRVYVDEFSAIGSDNILGMLARARDARMPCMLSTQALADLKKADPAFLEQALGIVNCFIIHRANTEADAETFAGLTGKRMTYKKSYGVEMTSGMPGGIGTGSATGDGRIEQVEDYVVPASKFQSLKVGELVYIAMSPMNRVIYPVTVIRENEEKVAQAIANGIAPLVAPTRRFEVASPFEPSEDLSEAFPSPWPVMAADHLDVVATGSPETEAEFGVSQPYVPVPLHEMPTGTDSAARTTPTGYIDLSEFDTPIVPTTTPDVVPQRPTKTRPAPVIDPAMYRTDVPHLHAPQATRDDPPIQPKEHPPSPSPQQQQDVPIRPTRHVDEDSVFGGGEVEWEESAPSWDPVDLGMATRSLPSRPPAPSTATHPGPQSKMPTTTERPKQSVLREDEWNE